MSFRISLVAVSLVFLVSAALGQTPTDSPTATKPAPAADVLVFTNGDQLTGHLERATGGDVLFKSDMAGEITVAFDKIKELRSGSGASQFALLRKGPKGVPILRGPVPEGTILYASGDITITPPASSSSVAPVTVKPAEVAYLVDKPTYDKAISHEAKFTDGWNGTVTGGATVVRSSTNGTTFTAASSLVRAIPTVPYLPARNRTLFNVNETYGQLTTVAPPPPSPAVKTSIFHADGERDEYFSPRLYALADAAFDHNYSQGLQFQQLYGGGIGWTPVQSPKQQLDVKVDIHYERQEYFVSSGTPSTALVGSTFAETYRRSLPHRIVFTEVGNFIPAWNMLSDYAANVTGTLALPVWKRLNASISTTDNYLNDPAAGFNKNSYQFVTGVTYSLR